MKIIEYIRQVLLYYAFDLIVRCQGVETKDPSHFIMEHNIERLRQAKQANRV
jgi:beta-aspartyl-peptidase (threonine type)